MYCKPCTFHGKKMAMEGRKDLDPREVEKLAKETWVPRIRALSQVWAKARMVLRLHLEMPLHSGKCAVCLGLCAWWIVTGRKRREGKPRGSLWALVWKFSCLYLQAGKQGTMKTECEPQHELDRSLHWLWPGWVPGHGRLWASVTGVGTGIGWMARVSEETILGI